MSSLQRSGATYARVTFVASLDVFEDFLPLLGVYLGIIAATARGVRAAGRSRRL